MYITVFCTLLSHHCMTGTWNFLISCSGLKERNNFLFLFLNLDTVLSDLTPEKFANIWQIKWNWTRSLKSETVWIQFLSDIFGLLSSRNFATIASWHNDFFSLYQRILPQSFLKSTEESLFRKFMQNTGEEYWNRFLDKNNVKRSITKSIHCNENVKWEWKSSGQPGKVRE